MSDMLGDRRFIASLDSVSSFSNFDFLYFDLRHRTNWGVRVFDSRAFFSTLSANQDFTIDRRQLYRETGAIGILSYPFDRYHRLDTGFGFEARDVNYPFVDQLGNLFFFNRRDTFPIISGTFSGDTTAFKEFGPIAGHRYELGVAAAPNIHRGNANERGGLLTNDYTVDARNYYQISSRALLASRVFAGYSRGTVPNFYYFGGLNTVRGYPFRSIIGTRAAFANAELRFPLIDVLATPIAVFQGIRANLFFDIGAASLPGQPFRFWQNHQLVDGIASVGYGVSFNLLGLELHLDYAKRTNLRTTDGKFHTEFWIGEVF
jgi:outer membrane protein assembly factor BamA